MIEDARAPPQVTSNTDNLYATDNTEARPAAPHLAASRITQRAPAHPITETTPTARLPLLLLPRLLSRRRHLRTADSDFAQLHIETGKEASWRARLLRDAFASHLGAVGERGASGRLLGHHLHLGLAHAARLGRLKRRRGRSGACPPGSEFK